MAKSTKGLEDKKLRAYYKWLKAKKWDANYFHVANELPVYDEKMVRFAANLKHKGKKPGVSDIVIFEEHQGYNTLWIELKTTDGKPSLQQLAFLHNRNNNGSLAVMAYGLQEAKDMTEWYMKNSKKKPPYKEVVEEMNGIKFKVLEVRYESKDN